MTSNRENKTTCETKKKNENINKCATCSDGAAVTFFEVSVPFASSIKHTEESESNKKHRTPQVNAASAGRGGILGRCVHSRPLEKHLFRGHSWEVTINNHI